MKPQILITGATGHLGRSVTRRFVERGWPVLAVARHIDALHALQEELGPSLVSVAACDIAGRELAELSAAHPEICHLIHLAACIRAEDSFAYYLHNAEAVVNLLGHFGRQLQSIIHLSTFDVYAIPSPCPIREDATLLPDTHYGASKLSAEKYLQVFALGGKVQPAMLRCASIYGPGQTIPRAMSNFLARASRQETLTIFGDGRELRDYIDVEDAARAVEVCFEKRAHGIYNLGGGEPVSVRQLAEYAIEVCGSRSTLEFKPRQKESYDLYLDISRLRELGFAPMVPLLEGMKREAASLRP